MVKLVFKIISIVFISSCMRYTEHGGMRPNINRFSVEPQNSEVFKEMTIYKLYCTKRARNNLNKSENSNITYYDSIKYREYSTYLLVYPNGRIQGLSLNKDKPFEQINSFNGLGSIGYYKDIDTNAIIYQKFIRGDGGGTYNKATALIKDDTIVVINKQNKFLHHIYLKKELPQRLQNSNPNW